MSYTTVVIADDHAVIRKSLRLMLEGDHHLRLIGEAADGQEALCAIRALQPDVLLMDINMPHMSGLDVLKRLRAEHQKVAIIILSNHSEPSYIESAMRWGADAFVAKASGLEVLMDTIHSVREGLSQHIGTHLVRSLASN